ncbi:hypothetical protein KZZ20_07510 [Methylacidiphilum fumariolicum]|nr:hypothetical protein [Candidatus Methylacidiphilum fumarolicum]
MGLESGKSEIRGDIRLVLNERRVEIHYSAAVKISKRREGEAGLSKVFTDDHGKRYEKGCGELLVRLSCVH